jgi:DNA-directed RNA polymerase specialized sigma24 family protein
VVTAPNRRWSLTREALERLLDQLGSDSEAAAREYETTRHRLIDFFDWRGARAPEALADETLDRVARRLDEGETVEHLRAYCYGVAKRVLLESEKQRAREQVALRDFRPGPANDEVSSTVEARVACLERCLRELPDDCRELIVGYYQGAGRSHLEGRRLLADRLGITYATLKTRAHRIRARLEEALRGSLERGIGVTNDGGEPPSSEGGVGHP